jgi:hypothetical protein
MSCVVVLPCANPQQKSIGNQVDTIHKLIYIH